jgi:hypothetical protein
MGAPVFLASSPESLSLISMDAFDLALKVGTGAQAPDIQLLAKQILVGARGCAGRRHPLEGLPVEEGWDKEGQEEQYTVEDGLEHSPQLKPWGEPVGLGENEYREAVLARVPGSKK